MIQSVSPLLTSRVPHGVLCSSNQKIARKQLLFLIRANALFGYSSEPNATQVEWFNRIPAVCRTNLPLLNLAIKSNRQYDNFSSNSILSFHDFYLRLEALGLLSQSILTLRDSNKEVSLLTFIGENMSDFLSMHNETERNIEYLCKAASRIVLKQPQCSTYTNNEQSEITLLWDSGEIAKTATKHRFSQCWNYTNQDNTLNQRLTDLYHEVINLVVRGLYHIRHSREEMKRKFSSSRSNNAPLPIRVDNALTTLANTDIPALSWYRHFGALENLVGRKYRPEGKCLGIELEFLCTKGSQMSNWGEDDFPESRFFKFKGDGSIGASCDTEQVARYQELNYFMNGSSDKDWQELKNVLNTLNQSGAIVNSTCGNHIHLDMRGKSTQQAARIAGKIRNCLKDWAHRTLHCKRTYNDYCGVFREHSNNKYTAVNFLPFRRFGTIEVRVGMASLNYHKIKLWAEFLQYCASPGAKIATFDDFMQSNAPHYLKVYIWERIMKFHPTYVSRGYSDICNIEQYREMINSVKGGVE